MKKFLAAALCLMLTLSVLTGCGSGETKETDRKSVV